MLLLLSLVAVFLLSVFEGEHGSMQMYYDVSKNDNDRYFDNGDSLNSHKDGGSKNDDNKDDGNEDIRNYIKKYDINDN